MGHIEGEMPFLQRHLVGLETLSKKWRRKIRGQKAAKPSFSSHLFCSPLYERESWRDERLREGYARGHTHTHTERERRCVIARFVRVTRERERAREIDAFFFLLCDERTYPNESEEGGIEKDDVAASFRVVFDDFDFGWFVHK
jgi:hypothetical protein